MFENVEVANGYVDVCKGLEEAAGPDKNGKPRKGAVILANTIAAAKRDLRPLPEILEKDGVRLVKAEDFPDLLMACPTTRYSFVDVLRHDRQSLRALFRRAGLTEAAAEAALQNAIQKILIPREAVEAVKKELAQLLQKSADSLKMRCHKYLSKVWIFSRFDGIALILGCSPNSSTVRMAWESLKQALLGFEGSTEGVSGTDTLRIPETFKFEGPGEQETPVTDLQGLVEMILVLPGQRAAAFRRQVSGIFLRVFGGDLSLIDTILQAHEAQAELRQSQPDHPATAFGDAAAALSAPSDVSDPDERALKRRRQELEVAQMEVMLAQAKAGATKAQADAAKAQAEADLAVLNIQQAREKAEAEAKFAQEKAEAEAKRAQERAEAEAKFAQGKAEAEAKRAQEKAEAEAKFAEAEAKRAQEKAEAEAKREAELAAVRLKQATIKQEEEEKQLLIERWKVAFTAGQSCGSLQLPPSASVRAQDLMQTVMFGGARDSPGLGKAIIASDELRKAGLPERQLSCFGKRLKARFLEMFPDEELTTHLVFRNGQEVETYCYFEKHRAAVDAALEDIRQKLQGPSQTQSADSGSSSDVSGTRDLASFFAQSRR
jgi:hypothetical protein